MKKNRSGTFRTSHRPTWRRNSPISQSLRVECPRISCMGGLAPGPNPLTTAAYLMQTLDSGRSLNLLIEYCRMYLFRPTSEFPSLWLALLIRKHQRMRNCKECLQRNLQTNIFSSLVVSKISKHKAYKFVLWKISYTTKSSIMVFTQRTLRLGAKAI